MMHERLSNPFEGLSPRTRGNRNIQCGVRMNIGPIPANAGEPVMTSHGKRLPTAYPRERGGTRVSLWAWLEGQGLSPRTRGNRLD